MMVDVLFFLNFFEIALLETALAGDCLSALNVSLYGVGDLAYLHCGEWLLAGRIYLLPPYLL